MDWIAAHPAASLALFGFALILGVVAIGRYLLPYVPTPPDQVPEQSTSLVSGTICRPEDRIWPSDDPRRRQPWRDQRRTRR